MAYIHGATFDGAGVDCAFQLHEIDNLHYRVDLTGVGVLFRLARNADVNITGLGGEFLRGRVEASVWWRCLETMRKMHKF